VLVDDGTLTIGPLIGASAAATSLSATGLQGGAGANGGPEFDLYGNIEFTSGGQIDAPAVNSVLYIRGGATVKKSGGPTKTALINAPIALANGGQIIVQQGTMSLGSGGAFQGGTTGSSNPFVIHDGATLNLLSSDGTQKTYDVVTGHEIAGNGQSSLGTMTVNDNTVLSIATGTEFECRLLNNAGQGSTTGFVLNGTGQINGAGQFTNKGNFW